ncbi:MAG: alpha-glucoside transport system permease protein [Chloroflexota bacterium]|jgi:alpha-glucoside transport system permease protein|nr:alpha-glucoside transport system permease protein [Chloroflexota bacterium]
MTVGEAARGLPATSVARRALLPLGALAGLAAIVAGLVFLADKNGAGNLAAVFYDLLGNPNGAAALRAGAGDRFVAKLIMAAVAILVGTVGVWFLYATVGTLVGEMRPARRERIEPWIFVTPALAMLVVFLLYPVVSTTWTALTEDKGALSNFSFALTERTMINALRNNAIWLVVGTGGSVILGLLIAGLVDRVRREALAKTFIFLPLAISLVGASVIWGFIYAWRPAGQPQYGLLNAVATSVGSKPIAWIQTPGVNTMALIVVMIWLQTGFAMVVLSAAIKGVSTEIIEAARLDGASERQLFFGIVVPMIKGSIITVTTTIAISVLKIFDIVFVMTGGRFDTDVVANRMFQELFVFGNFGHSAALAVILFLAVIPIMLVNLRNLRRQGIDA